MATLPRYLVPLLTEREVAEALNVSISSIRRWRLIGKGPAYVKINSSVRYQISSVEDFLSSRPTGGGTQ